MEIKEIEELMEILKKSDLSYISLERLDGKLTLKKACIIEEKPNRIINIEGYSLEHDIINSPEGESNIIEIKSLQIGKLYYSKGLEIGSMITEGDIIAKIKALGVLKDVKSAVTGKITELVVADGEVVGYGNIIARVHVEGGVENV
ncbi:MAG: hypothetical protein NTX05_04655 [Fusobacteria bacterium]|nr:hypothetical protein [Fusobacteriota bacterium]